METKNTKNVLTELLDKLKKEQREIGAVGDGRHPIDYDVECVQTTIELLSS